MFYVTFEPVIMILVWNLCDDIDASLGPRFIALLISYCSTP